MFRQSTLVFLLLAGALSLALFVVKYQYQDLEQELATLHRDIRAETRAIHVLKAEWASLNDPARLGPLAQRHLGLSEMTAAQLVAPTDVATLVLQETPRIPSKTGREVKKLKVVKKRPPVKSKRATKPEPKRKYSFSDIEKLLSRQKVGQ